VNSGKISAHKSRKCCLKLMETNTRFMILDDVVSHSRFPLAEIFGKNAVPAIEALGDKLSSMFVGTPQKGN